MDLSVFLAKVIGAYFIVVSLSILTRPKLVSEMMQYLAKEIYLVYILCFVTLIVGLLMVFSHNLWVSDWRVIITIVGWMTLIKGLFWLFFTNLGQKTLIWWGNHSGILSGICIVLFLMGTTLLYYGFK